ncbi:MAG: tRNA (adenosine(37)-N6)-dimethylallyltransferase MiaA [Candidatus Eisenbacteria bacterium]
MKNEEPKRLLILAGPTGVGKTDISIHLARNLSGEVVSADSRLVYRLMNIGTAKPDRETRQGVAHHMIDLVDPDEEYTSKRFEEEARETVRDVLRRGKTPIVVGGSGLYVKALTDGVFDGPGRDTALRKRLMDEAEKKGSTALWKKLTAVDPEKAGQIGPSNTIRLVRALEVYELTGRPMSELEKGARPFEVPSTRFGLTRSTIELYRIVDDRVDRMMELGFLDEVKGLIANGYRDSPAVRSSLGYRELIEHLEGDRSLAEAVRLIKRNTRHFAKRQGTWFRKDKDITWIDITGRRDSANIASEITQEFLGVRS